LLSVVAFKLALHLFSAAVIGYGYSADELYFLDCANHLAWGYVDHPPLSIALLALIRGALGDSLLVLRLTAAFAGAAAILLAGAIARELSGGRAAQVIAALAMLASPVVLFATSYYSLNAIELVVWALVANLMLRLINGADPRLWLVVGAVLGIGLLNKWSVTWLGLGLAAGLVLSPERRWLRTPWPWLAAFVAILLWMPNLLWQLRHDWPTLEFMRTGMRDVMAAKPPLLFVREQIRAMHPLMALLSVAGLLHYFASARGRPHRLLGWVWLTVFVLLMMSGTARPLFRTGVSDRIRRRCRCGRGSGATSGLEVFDSSTRVSHPGSRACFGSARGSAVVARSFHRLRGCARAVACPDRVR
jgi:4-amino-4-deoxy-L-arabinose transferase-like glycosyltransferase